jgi:phosphatidate cytidylyltransferase
VPDLPTRFAMGVVMIAVASVAIWFGGWPFRILITIAAAVTLAEWADMHRVAWPWTWLAVALLALLLLGGGEYLYPAGAIDTIRLDSGEEMWAIDDATFVPAFYAMAAAVAAGLLLYLTSRRPTLGWGFVYVAVPAIALLVMSWAVGFGLIFWVMVVTWATDIFAYFAGKTIGGPKLAPRISPAKTWAGLIGGAVGAGVCGWLVADFFALGAPFTWLGVPMAVIAQGGDLYESWVKRRCGVKDSGTMLPGHGGVLDRIDGLMAVSVASLAVLMAGLWTG